MARLNNQHLKVYNLFNSGVQNVPATHLINDTAFYEGIDYNIEDSTIKPIKGNSPYTLIPITNNTKQVIKENIKGEDLPATFDTTIDFVNFADTVYYIEDTPQGSELMQLYKDDTGVHRVPVFIPKPTATVTANTAWKNEVQKVKDEIYDIYIILQQDFNVYNIGLDYDFESIMRSGATTSLSNLFILAQNDPIKDDYIEEVNDRIAKLSDIKAETTLILNQTQGDIRTRAKEAVASSHDWLVWANRGTDVYALENINIYGDWDLLFDYNLTYMDDWQGLGTMFMVRNKQQLLTYLNAIKDLSILKYLPMYLNQDAGSDYNTWLGHTLPPIPKHTLHRWIELSIQDLQDIPDNVANMEFSDRSDAKYQEALDAVGTALKARNIHLLIFVLRLFGTDTTQGVYADNVQKIFGKNVQGDLNSLNPNFVDIHTILNKALNTMSSINLEDLRTKVSKVYVVEYLKTVGSYSPPYISEAIYIDEGIHIDVTPKDDTEYLIYANISGGAEPTLIDTITDDKDIPIPYAELGSVMVSPNQIGDIKDNYTSIAEYGGSIFVNPKDSQEVWFTEPNSPHTMTTTSFIKMPQDVKAMKTAGAGLFIWTTNNSLYLLTGSVRDANGNNTLNIKLVGQNVDIFNSNAVTSQDSLVVWLSDYAIHNTSGYGSATATQYMWQPSEPIDDVLQSIIHKGVIYFLVDSPTRKLIYFDTKRKAVNVANAEGLNRLSVIDNKLIGMYQGELKEMFSDTTDVGVYDVTLKTFGGYSYDTRLRFNSVQIAHSAKPYDTYDKELISEIHIYVDDFLVGTWVIQGTDSTRINLPITNNTGQAITLRARGKLNIKSFRTRYTPIDWED